MSKAKKVIFVIVEGPTDEDALSSVLKQIFSSAEVHFHVIHGDITTEDTKRQKRRIHKGTLDRPPGKQQKSGVELGAAGAGQCERGRSSG